MAPPVNDRAAEIALLAAAFDSKRARDEIRRVIRPGDFYQPSFEVVWEAMLRLDRDGRPVDIHTLRAALEGERWADALLIEVMTAHDTVPANAPFYAEIVRSWAVRRRVADAARQTLVESLSAVGAEPGWTAKVASRFRDLRDVPEDDTEADVYAADLVIRAHEEPDWIIPGLLERRDRLMLTGEEGLGKSHLLRQFGAHAAGGVHPFDYADQFEPARVSIVDCENTYTQISRALEPQMDYVRRWGQDPGKMLKIWATALNLTTDRDVCRLHQTLDHHNPDLVVIGPLHLLVPPGTLNNEEEAAIVLAALNSVRARGCAVLVEAHAGHSTTGNNKVRSLRPRGSSAMLGWPEFGYGMRAGSTEGFADLVPWRGDRTARAWPRSLRRADGFRWVETGGQT